MNTNDTAIIVVTRNQPYSSYALFGTFSDIAEHIDQAQTRSDRQFVGKTIADAVDFLWYDGNTALALTNQAEARSWLRDRTNHAPTRLWNDVADCAWMAGWIKVKTHA